MPVQPEQPRKRRPWTRAAIGLAAGAALGGTGTLLLKDAQKHDDAVWQAKNPGKSRPKESPIDTYGDYAPLAIFTSLGGAFGTMLALREAGRKRIDTLLVQRSPRQLLDIVNTATNAKEDHEIRQYALNQLYKLGEATKNQNAHDVDLQHPLTRAVTLLLPHLSHADWQDGTAVRAIRLSINGKPIRDPLQARLLVRQTRAQVAPVK